MTKRYDDPKELAQLMIETRRLKQSASRRTTGSVRKSWLISAADSRDMMKNTWTSHLMIWQTG